MPGALTPSGPQTGVKYVLTGPDGTRAVFNDPTDEDYVGMVEDIPGLDSPEVRDNGENLVGQDGGINGEFFYGRRPITLTGQIINVVSAQDRNLKLTKLAMATNALREDATLEWTPTSGEVSFIKVRRQNAIKVKGNWVKEFQIGMVAADPKIYSVASKSANFSIPGPTINNFVATEANTAGVATDASFMYWAHWDGTEGYIGRAKLAGTGVEPHWIKLGANIPQGVAVDANFVYWCNTTTSGAAGKTIGRATILGASINNAFISGLSTPISIAVNGTYIFWYNVGTLCIGRALLAGTSVETSFLSLLLAEAYVACDTTFVYWANPGAKVLGRAKVNGTEVNTLWVSFLEEAPTWPAISPGFVYWCNYANDTIGKANLEGKEVQPDWQKMLDGSNPNGLDVEGSYLYAAGRASQAIARIPLATVDVVNRGSEIMYPVVRMSGNLEKPAIRNNTTGETMQVNYATLSANQNFVPGTVFAKYIVTDENFIYYVNTTAVTIGRCRIDGTENNPYWNNEFFSANEITGLCISENNLCMTVKWSSTLYTVSKISLATNVSTNIYSSEKPKFGIAAGIGGILYFGEEGTIIKKVNNNGTSPASVVAGLSMDTSYPGMWADSNFIYYKASGKFIGRVKPAGTGSEPSWIATEGGTVGGIVTTATNIYWTSLAAGSTGTIARAEIGGTGIENKWISGASFPVGLTIAPVKGNLYWTNASGNSIGMKKLTASSATIIIDFLNRTVVAGKQSVFSVVDFNSDWFGMIPGDNIMSILGLNASEELFAEITWRNAWI